MRTPGASSSAFDSVCFIHFFSIHCRISSHDKDVSRSFLPRFVFTSDVCSLFFILRTLCPRLAAQRTLNRAAASIAGLELSEPVQHGGSVSAASPGIFLTPRRLNMFYTSENTPSQHDTGSNCSYESTHDAEDDLSPHPVIFFVSPLTVSLLESLAICSRCEHCGVSGEGGAGRPRQRAQDFQISSHVFFFSRPETLVRSTLDETPSEEGAMCSQSLCDMPENLHRPPRRDTPSATSEPHEHWQIAEVHSAVILHSVK